MVYVHCHMDSCTYLLLLHYGVCGRVAESGVQVATSWHVCDSFGAWSGVCFCSSHNWQGVGSRLYALCHPGTYLLSESVKAVVVMPHNIHSSSWLCMQIMFKRWIVCRPEGWPWGEAGLPDDALPEKKKQGSRRKRSSSPVSKDTRHADDAGPGSSEVSKPAAKQAKRSGRVGAAKVVKRSARRGTIPSLESMLKVDIVLPNACSCSEGSTANIFIFMPKPEA